MKSRKVLLIAAIVCLLVGASGTAMARNDCPDGTIVGGEYSNIVIDEYKNCYVVGVSVTGSVVVTNANNFTMIHSKVSGGVLVENTVSAALVNNAVKGNIMTLGNAYSTVVQNEVEGGQIWVNDDKGEQQQIVVVLENVIYNGGLQVNDNERADVKDNTVRGGNITCYGNDHLDSFFNRASWGTVDCR